MPLGGVEYPLGGQQPLDADRSSRVDPRRADSHLGTEAEPEAVRETGTRVVEDARTVHPALELRGLLGWNNEDNKVVVNYNEAVGSDCGCLRSRVAVGSSVDAAHL